MTGLAQYTRTADRAAATVIASYSTSFSLACRLLGPRVRRHVRNVYALVRVADEIVDGPGAESDTDPGVALDALENETLRAMDTGFSANLIVHAFANTARVCGIGGDLVRPFFASMRTDLTVRRHDAASHEAYVYGSAEVVGLMCLQVFAGADTPTGTRATPALEDAARRLGAAFQNVNFLRDLPDDTDRLGRDYLTGLGSRSDILDRIDADLDIARAAIDDLPDDCRRAVAAAHALFAELARRLRRDDGSGGRVSVPGSVKAALALRAAAGLAPRRRVA
ncbi:phytoene/squalene synthase family protein [Microbacterium sp.]|uniref:phytoene/squalene synthase family protein n=1 Tax=Microbacterium sp. TaxID=51671 RepID=UPI003A83B5E6